MTNATYDAADASARQACGSDVNGLRLPIDSAGDEGLVLGVDSYDKSGWVIGTRQWHSDGEDGPLAAFLQKTLAIPQPEAEALAATVQTKWVPEWEQSGGRERSSQLGTQVTWLIGSLAVLVVLAVLGLVLALFLIID